MPVFFLYQKLSHSWNAFSSLPKLSIGKYLVKSQRTYPSLYIVLPSKWIKNTISCLRNKCAKNGAIVKEDVKTRTQARDKVNIGREQGDETKNIKAQAGDLNLNIYMHFIYLNLSNKGQTIVTQFRNSATKDTFQSHEVTADCRPRSTSSANSVARVKHRSLAATGDRFSHLSRRRAESLGRRTRQDPLPRAAGAVSLSTRRSL